MNTHSVKFTRTGTLHPQTIPRYPVIQKSPTCNYYTRVGDEIFRVLYFGPRPSRYPEQKTQDYGTTHWKAGDPCKMAIYVFDMAEIKQEREPIPVTWYYRWTKQFCIDSSPKELNQFLTKGFESWLMERVL